MTPRYETECVIKKGPCGKMGGTNAAYVFFFKSPFKEYRCTFQETAI